MDESPVVLHVDDDPTVRDAVASALTATVPTVTTTAASTVAAGRSRLGDHVDAIVLEYDLPDGTGFELLDVAGERLPDVPVVLLTGSGDESVASRAISAGVTDYVAKGSGEAPDEVAAAIGSALDDPDPDPSSGRAVDSEAVAVLDADGNGRLPEVVQLFGDPVYLLDADGHVRAVNEAFEETFGYDRETVVGAHLTEFVDDAEYESGRETLTAVLDDDERRHATVEVTTERADGTETVAEANATPLFDGERFVGSLGTIRDVTDRHRRERRLETYRELVETVSDPMFKLDAVGHVEMVNDAMEGFGGYDRDELQGKHFTEFLDRGAAETGEAAVRGLLSEDGPDTAVHEFSSTAEDGEERVVENSLSLLTDDGTYSGAVGVLRDVTERNRRERELAQYETLIETVPVGMFTVDEDGVLTWANEEASELLDVDDETFQEEYVGAPYLKLVDDGFLEFDHVERYLDLVREMLSSETEKRKATHDVTVSRQDGGVRFSDAHTTLLPLDDGAYTGTVTAFRDITKQKEYERELERQNERLERFASVVSHDLRNPLTVAQGHLDAAKVADDPSSSIEEIEVSLDRMRELIEDVLALARQGQSVADPTLTDLGALVEEAWATVETEAATVRVETEAAILADETRLRQLFENLFRNAVEHGGRSVTVAVGDTDDGFYVEDDGRGVADGRKADVFELGYTTESTGTGFGLGIVSEIVEAHGWSVDLVDGEDGGARFELGGVDRVA